MHVRRLITKQGTFAVKKFLAIEQFKWRNFEQGQWIARKLQTKGIPVNVALCLEKSSHAFLSQTGANYYAIFPWCEGDVLSFAAAPIEKAKKIGELLAKIHICNLQTENTAFQITKSIWQEFNESDSAYLIQQTKEKNLPEIKTWCDLYFEALKKIDKKTVISHGDLIPSNVIWQNNSPTIIDWDAAGYIHPQIELLGVALNWSGINVGEINQDVFNSVLEGYQTAGGIVSLNQTIIYASLGSWLAWLAFNLTTQSFIETVQTIKRVIGIACIAL